VKARKPSAVAAKENGRKLVPRVRPAISRWEREARAASRSLLRGESPASRLLTPAPAAARQPAPESRGEPLPAHLRQRLERGFDADLSTVRVHHGRPAHELAAAAQARAFAAGNEIFFAEGAYSPHTREGLELLGHEIAHVLQQTAVPDARGLLRVRARFGTAPAQAQPDPPPTPPPNVWPDLRAKHLAAAGHDAGFVAFADGIEQIIGGEVLLGTPNPGGHAIDDLVRNQGKYDSGYKPRVAGLLYDVLKFQNLFDGAAHLVDRYPTLQTLRGWAAFADEMAAREAFDWVAGMLEGERPHPEVQRLFASLMTAWRVSLLRTGESLPRLGTLTRAFNEAEQALVEAENLGPNEREFRALQWLRDSDADRVSTIAASRETNLNHWREEHPGEPDPAPFQLQIMVATGIQSEAQRRLDETTNSTGQNAAINRILFSGIVIEAGLAAAVLQGTGERVRQFQARWSRENVHARLAEPFTPNPALARERSAERLRRALETQARAFFALNRPPAGQPRTIENLAPSESQIVERSTAMRTAVLDAARQLEERAIDLFAADEPDEVLLDEILFLRAWAELVAIELASGPEAPRGIDEILEYRLYIARELGALAVHYGWGGLGARVLTVLNAGDFNFSYLILLADWTKEESVSLANMPADLRGNVQLETTEVDASGQPLRRDVTIPLTAYELYYLFQFIQIERLRAEAEKEIRRVRDAGEEAAMPDFSAIVTEARNFDKPQRWHIPENQFRFVLQPDDLMPRSELVWGHPKTQAMLSHPEWQAAWLKLNPVDESHRVIMWIVPPITDPNNPTRLIDIVTRREAQHHSTERALNDIVIEQLGRPAENDLEWLLALGRAAAGDADVDAFRERIRGFLEQERTELQQPLAPRLRLLAGLARRALVEELRPLLEEYGSDNISNWNTPAIVLDRIRSWAQIVQPDEERNAQVAALFLALGQTLYDAFRYEERFDVIQEWYGFIALAIEHSRGENYAVFERILPPGAGLPAELTAGIPRETFGWFNRRRTFLERILERFEEQRRQSQERFGFESTGSILRSFVYAAEIGTGEANAFTAATAGRYFGRGPTPLPPAVTQQIYYEIVQIHRPFRFHPAYGDEGTPSYSGPILVELTSEEEPGDAIAPSSEPLLTILYALNAGNGPEREITVRADDFAWLTLLSFIIEERAFSLGMERLAETLETATEIGMDLVELVPGVGQGVAVARLVITLAQFAAEELPQIREQLLNDPWKYVNELLERIDPDNLSLERVWTFLLLSGTNPFGDYLGASPRRSTRATRGRSRLQRLIAAVARIRERFATSFGNIRLRMQGPLLAAQARVGSQPALQIALRALPNYIIGARELVANLPEDHLLGFLENPADLRESLESLLAGLSEIELPEEVIPMELAVETLVVMVLDRFGGKGRLLRRLLEITGALEEASRPIADALRNTSADPNKLWREEFLPTLQTRFVALRDELVAQIYALINTALQAVGQPALAVPQDLAPVELQATEGFPETDLWADEDTKDEDPHCRSPRLTGGKPLDPATRSRFERQFGHDFRHVRIHADAEAHQLVRGAGARALTTGSHIYLGPGLTSHSAACHRILAHELAHVLQQTGARPLGDSLPLAPEPGTPGRGIHYEPDRERAAEHMAEAAAVPDAPRPLPIEEEGGEGLAPSAESAVLEILGVLSGRRFQEQFDERVAQENLRAGEPPPGVQNAEKIWSSARQALPELAPRQYKKSFRDQDVRSAIKTYVSDTHGASITQAVRPLASLSQKPGPRPPGAPRGAVRPSELHARRFTDLLQQFVFSRTGVGAHISLQRSTALYSNLEVRSIHLGFVDARAGLWDLVKTGTETHMATSPQPGWTPFIGTDWKRIRAHMGVAGPETGVFHDDAYRLSNAYITGYIERRTAAQDLSVPEWRTYVDTRPTVAGQGLRVDTHGVLSKLGIAKRESHHIPQFLLVDYFQNDSSVKLFGDTGDERLPGFEPSGADMPLSFTSGSDGIDLGALATGTRGDSMPAVLLHEETHQRGNLHLNREPTWSNADETEGTPTQSATINRFFKEKLREHLGHPASMSFKEVAEDARAREDVAKPHILRAMRETYEWMYEDRMKPPLKTALEGLESAFYSRIAAKDHLQPDGTLADLWNPLNYAGSLDAVMTKIDQKNQAVLGDFIG
jgi:hypothetical protein